MSAILGSLLGFTSSFLPSIFEHFKRREEHKQKIEEHRMNLDAMEIKHGHQLQLVKLQGEVDLSKSVQTLKELESQGDIEQVRQIYTHDSQLSEKNQSPFIAALSASVRPIVTYIFFLMFLAVKGVGLYLAYQNNLPIDQVVAVVWNDETNAIFAAIISFWFGQRAIQKFSKK